MRIYKAVVHPANVGHFDDGLSIVVDIPARDRAHAIRRLRKYVPGRIAEIRAAGTLKVEEYDFPYLPLFSTGKR
jgi:hypothetical protein